MDQNWCRQLYRETHDEVTMNEVITRKLIRFPQSVYINQDVTCKKVDIEARKNLIDRNLFIIMSIFKKTNSSNKICKYFFLLLLQYDSTYKALHIFFSNHCVRYVLIYVWMFQRIYELHFVIYFFNSLHPPLSSIAIKIQNFSHQQMVLI